MLIDEIPHDSLRAPEPPAPPLSDLWRGGARGWLRHHVSDRAIGGAQMALIGLLRPMPPEASAGVGRLLGPLTGRLDDGRPYVGHMRRAIALIRPDLDAEGREAMLAAWWRHAGATHALYPSLDRLSAPERLTLHGEDRMRAADADPRPTIYVGVHLGMWELVGHVIRRRLRLRRPAFGIFEPQPNRFQNRMIHRYREARDIRVFPPSRQLPRTVLALMRDGCNPALFVDEVSEGRCKFPLWEREIPDRCNLRFVLRIAQQTGARLQPFHMLHDARGHGSFHALEPIEPRPDLGRDAYVETMARALSAAFEPRIAENLEQWYMLKAMRVPARPRR